MQMIFSSPGITISLCDSHCDAVIFMISVLHCWLSCLLPVMGKLVRLGIVSVLPFNENVEIFIFSMAWSCFIFSVVMERRYPKEVQDLYETMRRFARIVGPVEHDKFIESHARRCFLTLVQIFVFVCVDINRQNGMF